MVSRDVPLNRLINWSRSFNVDKDENVLSLTFYVGPSNGEEYTGSIGDREVTVIPDTATVNRLKNIRDQIVSMLKNTVLIEGEISEIWQLQNVDYPAETKVERVKIQG